MGNKIVLFMVGFLIWCSLRWPPDAQHIYVGLAVSALVAALTGDLFTGRAKLFCQPHRYLWCTVYALVFIKEWVKANIDIGLRLVNPVLRMDPCIVEIKTSLESDAALTVLSNTLTLTREIITVDIDKQKGTLALHFIDARTDDAVKEAMVRKFEKILKKIYEC